MFARVQIHEQKPIKIVDAGANVTNGAPVAYTASTNTVAAATANTDYVVISVPNSYDWNAVLEPNDAQFETIKQGEKCLRFVAEKGDIIATTELTKGTLAVGDSLTVSSGKFAAGSGSWMYLGEYDNPWGLTMYKVEHV